MKENSIDRRQAMKAMVAAASVPMLGARAADKRPNIVFILTDDHRYDAMGFMGVRPWLRTPAMDRLAAEGVHFQNSFVTTSLCSPSRASFLTGQYASRHGIQNNATPWRDSNLTFLEMLHGEGYRTGFIGKWHMPGEGLPDLVGQDKVDRMVTFHGQGKYFDCPLVIDGKKHAQDGYITDVLTGHAMDFLDSTGDDPFCLYLSHKAVHDNFSPPPRHKGALDKEDFREKGNKDHHPIGWYHALMKMNFAKHHQNYYEAVMGVDDSVAAVLEWLDAKGVAENTLVVYTGDNGFYWGEHGLVDKRYAYEEGMRVPHLLRFPRLIPDGGRKVDEMVLNVDLAPTTLAAAGIDPGPAMQGASYLELATGKRVQWRDSFLYEYFEDRGFPYPKIKGVRTKDYKLITYPRGSDKFPDELYNLANDPEELNDLIDDPDYDGKEEQLRRELARLAQEAL